MHAFLCRSGSSDWELHLGIVACVNCHNQELRIVGPWMFCWMHVSEQGYIIGNHSMPSRDKLWQKLSRKLVP